MTFATTAERYRQRQVNGRIILCHYLEMFKIFGFVGSIVEKFERY
jgi:hypothetical protein